MTDLAILKAPEKRPSDFFENKEYDQLLDKAIEETSGLVYPLDAEGEKAAKADATAINKFARAFDKFIADTFKQQTSEITTWRDSKKAKTKQLLTNRTHLINQFAEMREKKLANIKLVLETELATLWDNKGVSVEFQDSTGFDDLIKLSAITPKGSITATAKKALDAIASNNLTRQIVINNRIIEIENRSLRAEINPPLTKNHLGDALYANDKTFNHTLDQLVNTEIDRRKEMEQRIISQQEAKKQAEIEAAVAKAEKLALEKAKAEVENHATEMAANKVEIKTTIEPEPAPKPVNGKHTVDINFTLRVQISDRISDKSVLDHFKKQLPEKLLQSLIYAEAKSCH